MSRTVSDHVSLSPISLGWVKNWILLPGRAYYYGMLHQSITNSTNFFKISQSDWSKSASSLNFCFDCSDSLIKIQHQFFKNYQPQNCVPMSYIFVKFSSNKMWILQGFVPLLPENYLPIKILSTILNTLGERLKICIKFCEIFWKVW